MRAPSGSVVELIGNPRPASRTRALADLVAVRLSHALGEPGPVTGSHGIPLGEPVVIELGDAVGVSFGPEPVRVRTPLVDPFGTVIRARLLVVATPTYKATYSGLLKIFLDQLSQGDLARVVAVPVAIAGAPAHRESVSSALHELLVELGAQVPAPALALLESEVADQEAHVGRWVTAYAAGLAESLTDLSRVAETSGAHG
ncbi:FMN reductase [Humibacillus xanthopallidus]|uniref:FMN reductase n=1 Tax=Humibacillus xanthopallidus TaxID=412689 RepID=A0A543PR62_9MICO|nr:NAD(P)H-dependent oxidoreductase [Humibacillus xanthopallidus]TQN46566.1 FMN reductase [Humibacillus xanthopallidus]